MTHLDGAHQDLYFHAILHPLYIHGAPPTSGESSRSRPTVIVRAGMWGGATLMTSGGGEGEDNTLLAENVWMNKYLLHRTLSQRRDSMIDANIVHLICRKYQNIPFRKTFFFWAHHMGLKFLKWNEQQSIELGVLTNVGVLTKHSASKQQEQNYVCKITTGAATQYKLILIYTNTF